VTLIFNDSVIDIPNFHFDLKKHFTSVPDLNCIKHWLVTGTSMFIKFETRRRLLLLATQDFDACHKAVNLIKCEIKFEVPYLVVDVIFDLVHVILEKSIVIKLLAIFMNLLFWVFLVVPHG
jgi:hypothetical protein